MPEISIVMLNYNSFEDLIECYNNLKLQKDVKLKYIIVDNNSKIECVNQLKEWQESLSNSVIVKELDNFTKTDEIDIFFYFNKNNSGYSAGNNIGVKISEKLGINSILISNPDMRYNDNNYCLELYKTLNGNTQIKISSSRIIGLDNKDQSPLREISFIEEVFWIRDFIPFYKKNYSYIDDFNKNSISTVNKVMGCSFMIKLDFLKEIGYLVDVPTKETITTLHLDPEISHVAAPQLVVPADNARYALNAANARWGSLFDVFYGTDMIDEVEPYQKKEHYNPERGKKVFELAFAFLDQVAPLKGHSYADLHGFILQEGKLYGTLSDHETVELKEPEKFVGYTLNENKISSLLLKNNGLHVEIQIDKCSLIGQSHPSGIKDVIIESALSAIQDCEDSVAVVDAEDKLTIYRNWNGLMRGDLSASFENKGKTIHRVLNPDKTFTSPKGEPFSLKGRVLLLIRNVGIHMYTDAVTFHDKEIPEGFLDAFVTTLCAIHDLRKTEGNRNSVNGSVYIVKPKCHGPEEVAFINTLFERVEDVLALPRHTIKMGIMDEERRTTINLEATIQQAKERVFFINTGFLDRTGDEIHSCMELGAVVPKEAMKKRYG